MKLLALELHSRELRPGIWQLFGVYNQRSDEWDLLEKTERERGLAARPEPPGDDVASLLWLRSVLRELSGYYKKDPAFLIERFRRGEEAAEVKKLLAAYPRAILHTSYAFDGLGLGAVNEVLSAEITRPPFGEADVLMAAMVAPSHYGFFATALLGGTHFASKDVAAALEAAANPLDYERRVFSLFSSALSFDPQEDAMTLLTVDRSLMNEMKAVLA